MSRWRWTVVVCLMDFAKSAVTVFPETCLVLYMVNPTFRASEYTDSASAGVWFINWLCGYRSFSVIPNGCWSHGRVRTPRSIAPQLRVTKSLKMWFLKSIRASDKRHRFWFFYIFKGFPQIKIFWFKNAFRLGVFISIVLIQGLVSSKYSGFRYEKRFSVQSVFLRRLLLLWMR